MLAALGLLTTFLVVLLVSVWLRIVQQRIYAHGIPLLIVRYLAGQPHHGKPITDAGWSRPGTKALTPTGHAPRFWYRPQKHRMLRRCLRVAAVLFILWGLAFRRTDTLVTLALAAVAAAAYGIWRALAWWRDLKHRRTWMYPAHLNAAPLVGIPLTAAPGDWLMIEPDRSRVVAELPAAYNPDDKARQRLVETLTAKLGIEAPDVKWQMAGPKPLLELTQSKPPPAKVSLADMREAIEAAKADEIIWGPGKRDSLVKSSLSGDSPHVGLSIGSGGGKSETAKSLLVQLLHKGAIGLILDYKMTSHPWARGLPNVVTAVRVPEIHRALVWLGAEGERRREVAYAGTDMHGRVHADVGPRLVIVLEELNATVAMLRSYWREVRGKDDPARSPALTALDEVSFTGRSALMNLVYIGQRLSDKATGGGGDARENIGVLAFARYRPTTWKMLAPDFPVPPKTLHPGRLHVVSDRVQEAQGILSSTEDAREFAVSGIVSPLPYGMPGAPRETRESIPVLALNITPEQGSATVSGPPPPLAVSGGVTLAEAQRAGVFGGLTLAGVRTARFRDEAFPPPVGRRGLAHEYDPAALAAWAALRRD